MNPGIYYNLSNKDYHTSPGISKSGLDKVAKSPYMYKFGPPSEQTKPMLIGTATHCAVFEPDLFLASYVAAPDVDGRTKAGKETIAAFTLENDGKVILKSEEFDQVNAIANAVRSHRRAASILSYKGCAETSIYAIDPDTGELVKVRPDWMIDNLVVDLKTTQEATVEAFSRSCWNYRYHVQSGMYLDVANTQCNDSLDTFVFIVVESSIPYQVAIYLADDPMVDLGLATYRDNLRTYHNCKERDEWPELNNGMITTVSLPYWALK